MPCRSGLGPHKCFNCSATFPLRWAMRTDRIFSSGGRNDKSLGIVHDKRRKLFAWTFHQRFFAFAQIHHIHAAIGGVWNWLGEPMPAGLDKFALMKTRALFAPAIA